MEYAGHALAIIAAMLWASTYFIIQRLSSIGVSAVSLVGFQAFGIACVTLPVLLSNGAADHLKNHWVLIAAAAFITFAAQAMTFLSVKFSGTVNASLLSTTQPLWVAMGALAQGDQISAGKIAGGVLILVGAALLIAKGGPA